MPTLHHQMFHISPLLRCFRKCAKMRTFESERVNQQIAHMTLHHQMFHISLVLRCFRKCAKMRTLESERVNSCFNFGKFRKSSKTDLKANAYIQNQWKQCRAQNLTEYTLNMYIHVLQTHKYTEKSHLELSVLMKFSKAGRLAQPNTTGSTGKRCRSCWHPLTLLTLAAPTPLQTYI